MDDISEQTVTAFMTLMVLVWIFVAVGVVLAGLIRPQLAHQALGRPALAIMDPTGTAEGRS